MIQPVFLRQSLVPDHIMKSHVKQTLGADWMKAGVSVDMFCESGLLACSELSWFLRILGLAKLNIDANIRG